MGSTFDQNNTNSSMDQSEDEAYLFAMKLAYGAVLPMVLKSAIELDLFELIKKALPNASVTASELASQLPTKNPDAASMIDRILRLLSAHSILVCSVKAQPNGVERRYSLAPVCQFLTKNEDGVSLSSLPLTNLDKVGVEPLYHLKDAVLEGGTPFQKAHGMSVFEYLSIDPQFNNIFNRAMSDLSNIFTKKIVETYKGLEGLKSLVDVGGGTGSTINTIISKYPSIQGINFDLPHVIQQAPPYPGVEHISGDMFISVPKADAILMKWVCHDWTDEHCQKLLKNCYESLPENGKVIIADSIFPEEQNSGLEFSSVALGDLNMMVSTPGGKERTEKEFQTLAKGAGFKKFAKVCRVYSTWIMELHK